jgi:hypothetical protein
MLPALSPEREKSAAAKASIPVPSTSTFAPIPRRRPLESSVAYRPKIVCAEKD